MKIFDAHFHIIDKRHPLVPQDGYEPPSFTAGDYLEAVKELCIAGGAVVSGSFHGFDQRWLRAALEALGDSFVGVAQLPASVEDAEILSLNDAGVRALRFNLRRGGSPGPDDMERLARRIHDLAGWHAEVYVKGTDLEDLEAFFKRLPRLVIDHLGLRGAGRQPLLRLISHGAMVKASGFGRLDFEPGPFLCRIAEINPGALLFGTDLPSTRSPRPFEAGDLQLLFDLLSPDDAARAVFQNAVELYRPKAVAGKSILSPV
jgi:predicted TIM-barrel fold metal-dependent hydrolase